MGKRRTSKPKNQPPPVRTLLATLLLLAAALTQTITMPLLPTTHAAFICPTAHPTIALAREQSRRLRSKNGGAGSGPGGTMPFLMQSVVCKNGSVEVERTYVPSKKEKGGGGAADDDDDDDQQQQQQQQTVTHKFTIFTRIFRPMSLSSRQAAPILVLHGGPSVPPDYLYPLVDFVPYRSVVYYDQVGCGRSSMPGDVNAYSISAAIDDLEAVIKKLGLRRFHLYGQSFGGILAFEYLKRVAERKGASPANPDDDDGCLSVILSSAPTSTKIVETAALRLLDVLKEDDDDESTLGDRFRMEHQCRTEAMPAPLIDAYAHAGTVWRGTTAIPDYEAASPAEGAARMPSAMVMRGEHDFVNHECVEGWRGVFNHNFVRERVMEGCAHHGLLENGRLYGEVVNDFFSEYD